MKAILRPAARAIERLKIRISAARNRVPIPIPVGDWAIGADDIPIILETVQSYRQAGAITVLEFGSGVSTFVFSAAARSFSKFNLISMEADTSWKECVEEGFQRICSRLPESLVYRIAHIPTLNSATIEDLNLSPAKIEGMAFDIIFVDAPPDTIRANARLELAQEMLPRLSRTGCVIIHDTMRAQEMMAVEVLRKNFMRVDVHETSKGISILRFPA